MSADLKESLRRWTGQDGQTTPLGREAIAHIETLERQREELVEALRPFADFDDGRAPEHLPITQGSSYARKQLTIGDCRRARTLLTSMAAIDSADQSTESTSPTPRGAGE